jgi:hypothetical protein
MSTFGVGLKDRALYITKKCVGVPLGKPVGIDTTVNFYAWRLP